MSWFIASEPTMATTRLPLYIICTRIKTVHAHTETVLEVNLFGNTDFIDKNNIRN